MSEPTIYDSLLCKQLPLEDCDHITEDWLDIWGCIQTTLDALAAARYWKVANERLRAALAELSAEFRIGGDEHAAVRLETVTKGGG